MALDHNSLEIGWLSFVVKLSGLEMGFGYASLPFVVVAAGDLSEIRSRASSYVGIYIYTVIKLIEPLI